ncbi:isocitrate lyase/phosphoenolpyruvate mutase family protein [Enterococcus sp. ALS3]|uniref:Isocitrate lyase/phosphoenolpyruvate mutase family protein n=1 Tax=Enterococcus alishanensis TaxID=1303817 RepID=A0ABS6TC99_9ENTE|nr:isocitrate lyase/phosphoenolpyruvate mutase family protein [Enterococcus alishanensis]MBV7390524.1 isocitrate lyase/phosphoenolpyruvate mutase family protein [Enterococcus alishanensis]
MDMEKQRKQARIFSEMHKNGEMFILPNVWNVGSAVVFEKEGFQAVATSSAGVAYDLGYSDGEDISFEDLLEVVNKISNRIDVPLSVDFERGYGETKVVVKENAKKLVQAGAVGFNIEDGMPDGTLSSLELQLEKIEGLVELKQELEIDFVINARTCAYWLQVADEEKRLEIAIERGNAFSKAGADCIFIPGALSKQVVKNILTEISAPLNIILNNQFHDLNELKKMGVQRISLGSSPVRYIYNETIELAEKIKKNDFDELLKNPFSYEIANEYFK